MKEVKKEAKERMNRTVEAFKHELARVRTGRASPGLLEGIKVEAYGAKMPINHVATITAPQPDLLVVQPFDKNLLKNIEKAILQSELGLNPNNDGNVLRIAIPKLTEETRRELVRHVKKIAEEYKQSIRNIRIDAKETLQEKQKGGEISEDDMHRGLKEIQQLTDEYLGKLEELLEEKEREIMEV